MIPEATPKGARKGAWFFGLTLLSLSACASAALSVPSAESIPPSKMTCPETVRLQDLQAHQRESGYAEDELARWFHATSAANPRGLILALHGLNNKPSMMDPLAAALAERGFQTLRSGLRGHSGPIESLEVVTRETWLEDVHLSLCAIKTETQIKNHAPVFAIGFSLGGLMIIDLLQNVPSSEAIISGIVLLAPAITPRWYAGIMRLGKYFPSLNFPSFTPLDYRANPSTTGAAYAALFAAADAVQEGDAEKINLSTLVLMDPRDQTVSISGIKDFISAKRLTQWSLEEVNTDGGVVSGAAHHLIVDDQTLADAEWQRMLNLISSHFTAGVSGMHHTPQHP